MARYSDEQIAEFHSTLSSPRFNAIRLKVTTQEAERPVSPWDYSALKEGERDAELEPDIKRNQGSRVAPKTSFAATTWRDSPNTPNAT